MKIDFKDLTEEFGNNLKLDYDLKKKNWFNIGGKTKAFYKADNLKDLIKFLKKIQNHEKIFVLGAGSNTLISDKQFNGVVIKLSKNFKGVQRRFNKIFNFNNVDFYDDYAHHPTEIKEVLDGVKDVYKDYEKICIFQPHRISRLKDLKKEFTFAFKNADKLILFPIYTAGEKLKLGFSYLTFAREIIKNSRVQLFLVDDKFQLAKFIKANIYGKKIVIGMGAGTISSWMRELPKLLT